MRLFVNYDDYDVKVVDKWECPNENGVDILTMPNIPRPLHGQNMQPRTIYGAAAWNRTKTLARFKAGYKCEICGDEPEDSRNYHTHELFSYNYKTCVGTFKRVVAICKTDHDFIHSGRMLTLYRKGNPLYPKSYLLKVAEHGFKQVYEYNLNRGRKAKKRVYISFLDYLSEPSLHDEMKALIENYDISFYCPSCYYKKQEDNWEKWRVVVDGETYHSPYHNQEEWEAAMNKTNDTTRKAIDPFKGGVFDALDKMLDGEKI